MKQPPFPQLVRTGRWREGVAIPAKALNVWIEAGGLNWALLLGETSGAQRNEGDYSMSDVMHAYEKANEVVGSAQEAYIKLVQQFKGAIKNDLASISSSADRVQKENAKIKAAYEATANMLTTPEMEKAISNAERLATALKAISDLQNHSITFVVLDKKTAAG